jgi:hypothetical protein
MLGAGQREIQNQNQKTAFKPLSMELPEAYRYA